MQSLNTLTLPNVASFGALFYWSLLGDRRRASSVQEATYIFMPPHFAQESHWPNYAGNFEENRARKGVPHERGLFWGYDGRCHRQAADVALDFWWQEKLVEGKQWIKWIT